MGGAGPIGDGAPGWRPVRGGRVDLRVLGEARWTAIQRQPGRTAYRVETADGGRYFVKHYHPETLGRRVRDLWLRRKPQRAYRLGRRLERLGVETPRPLALFRRGRLPLAEALLVGQWLESVEPWVARLTADSPSRSQDAAALGRLVAAVHRSGYYHGDIRGNLVFAGVPRSIPWVIDLEDLRWGVSWRRRVKSLVKLHEVVPGADQVPWRVRYRFAVAYARAAVPSCADAKALWRAGEAEAARRRERRAD